MTGKRFGFSLIELLVALAILAAMTTIALRSVSGLKEQARYQQTTHSLDDLRSAIAGPTNMRGPDNSPLVTGFVADTGRLPNILKSASDPLGANGDPFNELLAQNTIPLYQILASATDPQVKLGVGWQGPYIRLGAGPTYIRDGWGHSFAYAPGGVPTGTPPVGTPSTITFQGSGAADVYGPASSVSIPSTGTGGVYASFIGQVTMNVGADPSGTSGPAPNATYSSPTGISPPVVNGPVSIWVCYFGPDCTTANSSSIVDVPVQLVAPDWRFTLNAEVDSRITIGPRVLKAYVLPSAVTTAAQFRTALSAVPSQVYAVTSLNVTALGTTQTVNLVLPHYNP